MYAEITTYSDILFHRQRKPLVNVKTRLKIIRGVVLGHLLLLVVPMALGIVFGLFSFEKQERIIIMPIDPNALTAANPSQAEPAPAPPNLPDLPAPPAVVPPNLPAPPTVTPPTVTPPTVTPPPIPAPPTVTRPALPGPPTPTPPSVTPPQPPRPTQNTRPQPDARPQQNTRSHQNTRQPNTQARSGAGVSTTASDAPTGPQKAAYNAKLQQYINMKWTDCPTEAPPEHTKSVVLVQLSIASNGRIRSAKIKEYSGYRPLDDSVRRLFDSLQNVPPPGYDIPSITIEMTILEMR